MPTFITPVEVTPGSSGSWVDVDVSAHVSGDTAGVFLTYHSTAANDGNIGWRKKGSTDDRTDRVVAANALTGAFVGVDSSQTFQAYVSSSTNIDIYLTGYVEDSEGTFVTNGIDVSPTGNDAFEDCDISSHTGGDTAKAAFLEICTGTSSDDVKLRMNGSTDNLPMGQVRGHSGAFIGVDGSEIFEQNIDYSATTVHLLGWLTDNVTHPTNSTDVTPGTADTWTDITSLTGSDVGAAYQIGITGSAAPNDGVRPGGSSLELKGAGGGRQRTWILMGADGNGDIEGYGDTTNSGRIIQLATFQEPSAGGGGTTITGTVPGITAAPISGSINASRVITASVPGIAITPVGGSVSISADTAITGSVAEITATPVAGGVNASTILDGSVPSITVTPVGAGVNASTVITGSIPGITATSVGGSVVLQQSIAGSVPGITITPAAATIIAPQVIVGTAPGILVTPVNGTIISSTQTTWVPVSTTTNIWTDNAEPTTAWISVTSPTNTWS